MKKAKAIVVMLCILGAFVGGMLIPWRKPEQPAAQEYANHEITVEETDDGVIIIIKRK